MEPENPFKHLQEPAISPYPGSDQRSPCPISLLEHRFNIILPSTRRSPKWSLSLGFPHQNSALNCHTCHMHNSPQSSFDLPDATRSVYIIKFLIMQPTPVSCYLFRL